MSVQTLNLTPELYDYLLKNSLREPAVLAELRQETHKLSMSQMQIAPEQGQFMRLIIKLMGAKKTLDIGVFTGYSSLSVALALPQDGRVVACDINSEWTSVARQFWTKAGVAEKIDLRLAPALETLQDLVTQGQEGTFDFAFIDADKANYPHYYEYCLQLVRKGGLIALDNTLWDGRVADPHSQEASTVMFRKLNEFILKDDRVTMSMLPIADGLTLTLKN